MNLPRVIDGGRRPLLGRLVANGLAQAVVAIVVLRATSVAFDGIVRGVPLSALAIPAAALATAALFSAGLVVIERVDAERLGQSYARQLRSLLFNRLTRTAARSLQQKSRGGLALRLSADVTALRQWVSLGVARLSSATVTAILTLVALAAMNLPIALAVGGTLVAGTLLSIMVGAPLAAANSEARRRRSRLAAHVAEMMQATAVLQVHHRLRREQRRVERQSRQLERAMVARTRWIGLLRALGEATGRLAALAALAAGALQVRAAAATAGEIVAAVAVVALLGPAVRDLGRAFELWSKARQVRTEIGALLRAGPLVRSGREAAELPPGGGALAFSGVTLTASSRPFDLSVPAGTRVAIVGPNGGGKSTLLWLAARLAEPLRGRITLDGADLQQLTLRSLRRAIGIAGDGLPLVRGTIADNLAYRWPDASRAAIEAACAWAGLDDTLRRLPAGLDTRLSEQGCNLSAGERQRIALARAVLGSPRLLLLDEIDAGLDAAGRAWVAAKIRTYAGTVLFATHDPDWIRSADVVWQVTDGNVIAVGDAAERPRAAAPTTGLTVALRAVP